MNKPQLLWFIPRLCAMKLNVKQNALPDIHSIKNNIFNLYIYLIYKQQRRKFKRMKA